MSEALFLLVILKIPVVYLGLVVWWAIRASPEPPAPEVKVPSARYTPSLTNSLDPALAADTASRPRACAAPVASSKLGVESAGAPMSTVEPARDSASATDVVAGLLAASSIALSAFGMGAGLLLEVGGHPGRLIPVAAVLAIVAGVMSARFESLALKALIFASVAFVVGMTIAVLTDAPFI